MLAFFALRTRRRRFSVLMTAALLVRDFSAASGMGLAMRAPEPSHTPSQPRSAGLSFGMVQTASTIRMDTGAGLVFTIRRSAAGGSSRGAGDIGSMIYDGVEYQDDAKGSQINSGFAGLYDGQANVDVEGRQVDPDHIKVTVRAGDLVHCYMARRGVAAIFMATRFSSEPKPGLVRFIARIRRNVLPDGPPPADIAAADRVVEAHDVVELSDGETRSKHYSSMRLKDWHAFGARGPGGAVWMVRDGNEGGSGGPFYRSLLDQGTPTDQELTYIVNYGEAQTEAFRTNVLDSYALVFTQGEQPKALGTSPLDTRWSGGMGLDGYVGPDGRGRVAGTSIDGMDPAFGYTVGFANGTAQYWADATPGSGTFVSEAMLPGTYRLTIYKNELAVASRMVSVAAGRTTPLDTIAIDADPGRTPAIWRIGRWDGTPAEFLNGDRVTVMPPSDRRMAAWTTPPFVIGRSNPATGFPAYQWKDVNGTIRIQFALRANQVAAMTLRVGITDAFANARPAVMVNDWTAPTQVPSVQPTSRTLTVGSYRGNNQIYAIAVPANALYGGTNEVTLSITSGKQGAGFLSPGLSYDAVDLVADSSTWVGGNRLARSFSSG